jgi:hypothetical protein
LETDVPTVAEVVRRAVAICDPDGHDDTTTELEEAFEDDDRPAPGLGESLREELRSTARGLDPEGDSAAVAVAAAVAIFLASQPRGGDNEAATIREAVRIEWGNHPPEYVKEWLEEREIGD